MLLIASIAMALAVGPWCFKMWGCSAERRHRAEYEALAEGRNRVIVSDLKKWDQSQSAIAAQIAGKDDDRKRLKALKANHLATIERIRFHDSLIIYHARLREKYSRAAYRPWLPVAPDPPDPVFDGPKKSPSPGFP
jgi:hypothetical protein